MRAHTQYMATYMLHYLSIYPIGGVAELVASTPAESNNDEKSEEQPTTTTPNTACDFEMF